jgi:hypothetical protein
MGNVKDMEEKNSHPEFMKDSTEHSISYLSVLKSFEDYISVK